MRFMQWILGIALSIGIGTTLLGQTYKMAKAAVKAHQQDQMSYLKFTRAMLGVDSKKNTK